MFFVTVLVRYHTFRKSLQIVLAAQALCIESLWSLGQTVMKSELFTNWCSGLGKLGVFGTCGRTGGGRSGGAGGVKIRGTGGVASFLELGSVSPVNRMSTPTNNPGSIQMQVTSIVSVASIIMPVSLACLGCPLVTAEVRTLPVVSQ